MSESAAAFQASREANEKLAAMRRRIGELGSAIIAFSGGVDSTLVLKVAVEELGEAAIAVTGVSETYPEAEMAAARDLARLIGARLVEVPTRELSNPHFSSNRPSRCFHCKTELFTRCREVAAEMGAAAILDGTNASDLGDFRPGLRANANLGVISPLAEAGLSKAEIRDLSRQLGLPTWSKPSFACLSSRFPYGAEITGEKLRQVDRGEVVLHALGFIHSRLRHHDTIARIEVPDEDIPRLVERRRELVERLKEIGFTYVTVDLAGYRTGSMNEVLPRAVVQAGTDRTSVPLEVGSGA